MLVFNICRGSYHVVGLTFVQDSLIVLDGLITNPGEGRGYLVSGFRFNDHEKVGIIQCFDDYNHIYAFGHDPEGSAFAVTYTVFLGMNCMRGSFLDDPAARGDVLNTYLGSRVSYRGDTIQVTMGPTVFIGIVEDCALADHDAEINTMTVTISGKLTEVFRC